MSFLSLLHYPTLQIHHTQKSAIPHQPSQKQTTIPLSSPTLANPHYPLLCTTTLASLVKGRWIDGKAQTVALLRFTCNTSAFLFTKLFCRQDGGIALHPPTSPSPQSSQKHINRFAPHQHSCLLMNALLVLHPHYPTPRTKLASLVKGRWIDGKPQTVALLRFACDTSTFLIYQTFCRQDGGIATLPFAQHHIYASLVKGEVLSPKKIRATTGGIATPPSFACTNPSKTALSHPLFVG